MKKRLPRWKRVLFTGLAMLLAVIAILIVTEAGLRGLGALIRAEPLLPVEHLDGRSGPEFVIYCTGDSHTYGIGAPTGYSFPDQLGWTLRRANPKFNWSIRNEGRAGDNSSQSLNRLLDDLSAGNQIDLVLFCVGKNNDHHLYEATFLPARMRLEAPRLQWAYMLRNSRTYRLGRITVGRIEALLHREGGVPQDLSNAVISTQKFLAEWLLSDYMAAAQACRERGIDLVIIGYVKPPDWMDQAIKKAVAGGIYYLENTNFGLGPLGNRMKLMAPDQHPNARGYGVIAARVARFIAKKELAPVSVEQVEEALKDLRSTD